MIHPGGRIDGNSVVKKRFKVIKKSILLHPFLLLACVYCE
jgi:hypothetical protein